jgi:integrase
MAKLTAKAVEAIKPARARKEIPDALLPGLYLVVQPSGAKSWAVRYRRGGRPRKLTLGPHPALDLKAARELGAKALRSVAEGRDPASEKQARPVHPDSIEDVVARFIEKHIRRNYRPKPAKEAERLLRVHVLRAWRGRTIGEITRRDAREMLDRIVEAGAPVAANRVHSITRKLFGWAVEHEIIAASPMAGLKAPAVEKSRDRVLTDDELCRVWNAAGQIGDPIYGAVVRVLILTGQRRGEVAGMEQAELDLEGRLWSLPKERTKNARAHDVPLSPQAIAVINNVPRTSERFVFSFNDKAPINGFGWPKERLDALCGFSDWTLHDIRRTVTSGMARLGISLPVIEKVLNHASGSFAGIVGIYQRHDFAGEKAAALKLWGEHVAAIVADKGRRR